MKSALLCLSAVLCLSGCDRLTHNSGDDTEKSSATAKTTRTSAPVGAQEKRFVFPVNSNPFPESSVALDTITGQLCKTYSWKDDSKTPQGLPLCSDLVSFAGGSGKLPSFKEWKEQQENAKANRPPLSAFEKNPSPSSSADAPFIGATKAYKGLTYTFNGTKWLKGAAAEKYNEKTQGMDPWSDDQYDPLGLFTKEEKAKTVLTEARIVKVADQFGVSYEDAREEAKHQGYQVPPKY